MSRARLAGVVCDRELDGVQAGSCIDVNRIAIRARAAVAEVPGVGNDPPACDRRPIQEPGRGAAVLGRDHIEAVQSDVGPAVIVLQQQLHKAGLNRPEPERLKHLGVLQHS